MDAIVIARTYIEIHLLLTAVFGICLLLGFLAGSFRVGFRPAQLLPISYYLLLGALILPVFLPSSSLTLHPPIQVWSAPALQTGLPNFHSATVSFSPVSVPFYSV